MERVRKSKAKPTLESIFFVTPEQRLLRFLVSESTSSFTPRVLSSKLKGVRGLGGADGISRILKLLQEVGMVSFVNNNQAVMCQNDSVYIRALKTFSALCDLEGLQLQLEPLSTKGVLYGSRANGTSRTDSNYDLFIVTDTPDEVTRIVEGHPLGKRLGLETMTLDDYLQIESKQPEFAKKLAKGIVMWGSSW
ncbi:MAG: hypothetical protein AB7P04_05735 [Bacteriovoracia bacterium]